MCKSNKVAGELLFTFKPRLPKYIRCIAVANKTYVTALRSKLVVMLQNDLLQPLLVSLSFLLVLNL